MNLQDVTLRTYERVDFHASIDSVETILLRDGFVAVFEDTTCRGLLTVADTLQKPHRLVADCLVDRPQLLISTELDTAIEIMESGNHRYLPVFSNTALLGVISYKAIAMYSREERNRLQKLEQTHLSRIAHFDALRAMAGGVVHDFNNYLTVIQYCIEAAQKETADNSLAKKRLEEAKRAIQSANTLATQLLTYSKTGRPRREPVDIESFVVDTVTHAVPGEVIDFQFTAELPTVHIDRIQFERVISNLALNAVQAKEDSRGKIRFGGERISLFGDNPLHLAPGEYILLTCTDNGPGIPQHVLSRIFDPYFSTKKDGNGLGLAIAYSIALDHGGVIVVDSTPGGGTAFKVYIPTESEAAASQ